MPIQLQLESRGPVTVQGTTATIGSGPGCDLVINLHHIQPEHAQIRRMLGKWLVESRGDWLIQVDDGVPARKGWLTNGATIWLSEQGPQVTFNEAAEGELPDVIFDELTGEEVSPPASPPKPPGPVPRKPVTQTPPVTPQKKSVAQNPPATPAAAPKKTVKKVVKKVAATPPPAQPPQPKPTQPGGFDVVAFLMGGDDKPAKPTAPPPAQSAPQSTPAKPGGVRSVPAPPELNPEPPVAGKLPEKKTPEKSGPAKCDRCNVPLRPTGQCPACGRQY